MYRLKIFWRGHRNVFLFFSLFAVGAIAWYFTRPPIFTDPVEITAHQTKVAEIIAKGDFAECDNAKGVIDGIDYKKVCVNNIAETLAKKTMDSAYCEKLDGVLASVGDCKLMVATAVAKQNNYSLSPCDNLSAEEQAACRDNILFRKALSMKDIASCDLIQQQLLRSHCSDGVLAQRLIDGDKNVSCGLFSELGRDDCVRYLGRTKISSSELISYCGGFLNPRLGEACLNR